MKGSNQDQGRGSGKSATTADRLDLSPKMNQINTRREVGTGQGMAEAAKPRIAQRGQVATQQQRRMTISKRCAGVGPLPLRRHIAEGE
jgi:hypothetical protein